jgi:pimeloyl-ACP methyl ester carboxylesterase
MFDLLLTGFFTMRTAGGQTLHWAGGTVTAMTTPITQTPAVTDLRPFRVDVPDDALTDLRRRIAAARWPAKETVGDGAQGVQLATLQALARYWATEYDWRRCEAQLNALPQFTTAIDELDIHFIHVRSPHADALPLVITHGWPGSVIELLEVAGPLTDPTAHGGSAEDAFHLVLPSLPGYGFSGNPTSAGWDPDRIARAWATLMARLGYTRYVAQGGDQGASVTDALAQLAPTGLLGVHFNFLRSVPPAVLAAAFGRAFILGKLPVARQANEDQREAFTRYIGIFRRGYIAEMIEHPQTIGYAQADSPVGLAAWILDHDADSYEKISRAFLDGEAAGSLTRDRILDNITLYWLTNSGSSAARLYWEEGRNVEAAFKEPFKHPPAVSLPVAFTVFPAEIYQAPRNWVEHIYPNLVYYNKVDKGGHFAAWEEPALFATEMRAAFRSMR